MNSYFDIDYEFFHPIIGRLIEMPIDFIMYRGYDLSFNKIEDRSLFFGDYNTAINYQIKYNNRAFGIFGSKKQLKLIDIRYMIIILNEFIKSIPKYDIKNPILLKIINCLTVSFGLTDFENQLFIIEKYLKPTANKRMLEIIDNMNKLLNDYNNTSIQSRDPTKGLYRLNGVRFGDSKTDELSVSVLKIIFENVCDGFIAPRLWTPMNFDTHYTIHHEICIFNPIKSNIYLLSETYNNIINSSRYYNYNIYRILQTNNREYITEVKQHYKNLLLNQDKFKGGKNTIDNNDSMFIRNKAIMNNKNYKKREDKLKNILKNYKIILSN